MAQLTFQMLFWPLGLNPKRHEGTRSMSWQTASSALGSCPQTHGLSKLPGEAMFEETGLQQAEAISYPVSLKRE